MMCCVVRWSAVLWPCLLAACGATLSGFYVDNGVDQTVVEHVLTVEEKKEVGHEILNLLGLQARPHVVSNLTSSAPKFLLDVYKSLLEPAATHSEFNLSGQDLHAIDESDVIMSFASHSHHASGMRHERGKRLWFDVSEVPAGETIVGAELRLYHTANDLDPAASFTLSLYQLTSISKGQKELQFVDAVNTSCDHEGWLVLNVTGPFTTWVAFPQTNLGLYLSAHLASHPDLGGQTGIIRGKKNGTIEGETARSKGNVYEDGVPFISVYQDGGWNTHSYGHAYNASSGVEPEHSKQVRVNKEVKVVEEAVACGEVLQGHEVRPEELGIVGDTREEQHRPFMVAFFKAPAHRDLHVRAVRDVGKKRSKSDTSYVRNPLYESNSHWSSRSCQLQNLYVNFRDLAWQEWIIAPEGFHAFFCSGECNFPLNTHMNATNHAIVQTLVHLMNPMQVPKPCCAPTRLSSISVLYFIDDINVVLQKFKNMVVKSCGCH